MIIDFLWGAIGNLEERYPIKSYVVMATCLYFSNQQEFLGTMPVAMQFDTWSDTPNQQKWAAALKSMAESIQNSFGKSRACLNMYVMPHKSLLEFPL